VSTWFLGDLLARRFELTRPQHVLLAMTTTARNSPLMLGLATIFLPDQPMVYAVLIIGMLVEFPHLTFLTRVFRGRNDRFIASTSEVLPSN
jgi:predicted Na+-dependent transporter